MADEAPTPSSPTAQTGGIGWKHVFGEPLSRVQTIVATLTGIISLVGAVYSLAPSARSPRTGELVTTVQEAGSHRSITDATIEVLTSQNEIVATLTPDATGRATRDLTEGSYVVRITHPRYAAETRRVQVLSRQTVEIRANLRTGSTAASPARSPSAVERAVDEGLRGTRRALGF